MQPATGVVGPAWNPATATTSGANPGECASTTTTEPGVGVRYRMGADGPAG